MNVVNSIVSIPIKDQHWPPNIGNDFFKCKKPNAVQYIKETDQSERS